MKATCHSDTNWSVCIWCGHSLHILAASTNMGSRTVSNSTFSNPAAVGFSRIRRDKSGRNRIFSSRKYIFSACTLLGVTIHKASLQNLYKNAKVGSKSAAIWKQLSQYNAIIDRYCQRNFTGVDTGDSAWYQRWRHIWTCHKWDRTNQCCESDSCTGRKSFQSPRHSLVFVAISPRDLVCVSVSVNGMLVLHNATI